MTLGSLFDGAGGFPFAAQQYGIKALWASEIELFPVAVTTKRFPDMKHLGDITKINGAEIEPVDIITFGSPCQDLSVAGRRAGLDGERSGLFMEAVRIIKEMRRATNGANPVFAVWENVPGAFSSNKGEDFRVVLEELCKVKDGNANVPRPDKGKWSDAGEIVGDGYSVAWRVLDAQYWGVPQRRRRIFLVADFRGGGAGKVLFEREGLSRDFAESRESWKGITKSLAFCSRTESGEIHQEYGISPYSSNCMKSDNPHSGIYIATTARTLGVNAGMSTGRNGVLCVLNDQGGGVIMAENGEKSPCLRSQMKHHEPIVFALDRAAYNQGANAQYNIGVDDTGGAYTVIAKGPGAVCYIVNAQDGDLEEVAKSLDGAVLVPAEIILRRLTPTECARLQGMPDWWCDDVPHSDSAEYKMWGNGMALPCVMYVMEGIANALREEENK